MHKKTHQEIAAELRAQLKVISIFLPVEKLPSFDSHLPLPDAQRLGVNTFASQIWLCETEKEVGKLVETNPTAAKKFYPVAAFVVENFIENRDLTTVPFSGWGHFAMLSDVVTIYLKEIEGITQNGSQA